MDHQSVGKRAVSGGSRWADPDGNRRSVPSWQNRHLWLQTKPWGILFSNIETVDRCPEWHRYFFCYQFSSCDTEWRGYKTFEFQPGYAGRAWEKFDFFYNRVWGRQSGNRRLWLLFFYKNQSDLWRACSGRKMAWRNTDFRYRGGMADANGASRRTQTTVDESLCTCTASEERERHRKISGELKTVVEGGKDLRRDSGIGASGNCLCVLWNGRGICEHGSVWAGIGAVWKGTGYTQKGSGRKPSDDSGMLWLAGIDLWKAGKIQGGGRIEQQSGLYVCGTVRCRTSKDGLILP